MKTSSGLALAAVLAATAGAVYTGLPAAATQPSPTPPSLPPVVLDPGVKLPPPVTPDVLKPAAEAQLPAVPPPPAVPKVELPPLPPPPTVPAPLPVVPLPVKAAPVPIPLPDAANPVKLPSVPPPPVTAPTPQPLPTPVPLPAVPPPVFTPAPMVTPPTPLPAVPPPDAAPKAIPLPAPRAETPQPLPLPAPRAEAAKPLPPPLPVTPVSPPSIGSVVVLQDGKVVEGHVSRTGEKVIVRRGVIDQPFPKDQVKYVAKDKDEAYRLVLKDTKADEPAARLRLARWCMYNGMREQALTEAREVIRLEPANRAAAELARTLDESLRLYPGDGTARATPPAPQPVAPGLPAVPPPPAPAAAVPEPDLAPEAVVAFGPRVEPVLMNQCASCHGKSDYAGTFKLVPVASNETNPAATRQNLRAAAGQIRKSEPGASPLLVKALAAHGGMTAPAFADREAMPFRILHAWAFLAVGELAPSVAVAPPPTAPILPPPPRVDTPAADVRPMLPPPPLPTPEALPLVPASTPPPIPPAAGTLPPLPVAPPPVRVPPPIPPAGDGFGQSAPPPATPTGPAQDEFDPAMFNRPPAR